MPARYAFTGQEWEMDFHTAQLDCWRRIQISESRAAVSTYLTETAKRLNHRATKEVKGGAPNEIVLRGLGFIVDIALAFEKKLGTSVTVQRRNNEVMHRRIAKELAELLAVATGFYDLYFLRDRMLLDSLRQLHATTGTCYQGVLKDLESIEEELEEQERVKQESKPII